MFTLLCAISIQILKFFCKDRRLLLYMSRTLHLFGTDWCAMMVPIQVIRWYRMQCYDGTDSCATVVPIRRYCQIRKEKLYFSILPFFPSRFLYVHAPKKDFALLNLMGSIGSLPANICWLNSSNLRFIYRIVISIVNHQHCHFLTESQRLYSNPHCKEHILRLYGHNKI